MSNKTPLGAILRDLYEPFAEQLKSLGKFTFVVPPDFDRARLPVDHILYDAKYTFTPDTKRSVLDSDYGGPLTRQGDYRQHTKCSNGIEVSVTEVVVQVADLVGMVELRNWVSVNAHRFSGAGMWLKGFCVDHKNYLNNRERLSDAQVAGMVWSMADIDACGKLWYLAHTTRKLRHAGNVDAGLEPPYVVHVGTLSLAKSKRRE